MLSHSAVFSAAAVALPDPYLGEKICAAVVFTGEPVSLAQLNAHLEERGAAAHGRPDMLVAMSALPTTPIGKIEAGVRAVVNMSQISARREAKSDSARAHWISERMLDRTALITTHLRPTFFTNWQYDFWVRRGNEGIYRLPFSDVRHAPIDAADQARVIAAILQNPGPHDRQIYPLYGDKELNYYEIAAKVQEKLGIPVRYEPIDIPTFAAGLAATAGPYRVQHLSSVAQDYLDGVFSGTNNLVEVIGGTKPRTIEDSVAATRSLFETDGAYGITDARLRAA
jgi:uncharacterized protein YbjT (DUF2867 family)